MYPDLVHVVDWLIDETRCWLSVRLKHMLYVCHDVLFDLRGSRKALKRFCGATQNIEAGLQMSNTIYRCCIITETRTIEIGIVEQL